jgi:protoporphyrinogen oxidase
MSSDSSGHMDLPRESLHNHNNETGSVLMSNIVVLGSGMGGLGAAHRLHAEGIRPVIYEKSAHYGGHTASFRNDQGFLFDLGPHISFTKDQRVQDLLAENVQGEYESIQIYLNNYWRGHWLTHPVQLHMHGLPENLIVEIVDDFVAEQHAEQRAINNYEDWLVASYGRKFAELFPMQYTRKYHLTSADNMSTDWLGPRMYRPSLKERSLPLHRRWSTTSRISGTRVGEASCRTCIASPSWAR